MSFNSFYYSFSPQVASFIVPNPPLRYFMKAAIYPLIAILSLSKEIFLLLSFNGELAVTFAGIFSALGIGIVYFGPALIVIRRLRRSNNSSTLVRIAYVSCAASLVALIVGEASGISGLLMVGSVSTVLSFSFLGAVCAVRFCELLCKRRILLS
jgi:hypothetical protein